MGPGPPASRNFNATMASSLVSSLDRWSPLLSAHAIKGVAIPSGPTKLMRGSERICYAAAYAYLFD